MNFFVNTNENLCIRACASPKKPLESEERKGAKTKTSCLFFDFENKRR